MKRNLYGIYKFLMMADETLKLSILLLRLKRKIENLARCDPESLFTD